METSEPNRERPTHLGKWAGGQEPELKPPSPDMTSTLGCSQGVALCHSVPKKNDQL